MPIAQMNWGLLRFPIDDPRLKEFLDKLAEVYGIAERHPGFLWRVPDEIMANQIASTGFDDRMSATVSVWRALEDLYDFTFNSLHGAFLDRRSAWFEKVEGPQLVVWDVEHDARPTFAEAWERLQHLKLHGSSDRGYGWTKKAD